MSAVKSRALINDIISYDNRNLLGGISLDKNIIECKKIQKNIKNKKKEIEKKTAKNENINDINTELDKMIFDYMRSYSERLILLFNVKEFTVKNVEERHKIYTKKIEEYKNEIKTSGEKNFQIYKKQESDKIDKSGKTRNILSKDDYFKKIIGNHEKSNIERKISHDLMNLYNKFKSDIKSNDLKIEIIEKETILKNHEYKQKTKTINAKQMIVMIDRVKSLSKKYVNDITTLLNDDDKLQNFNLFVKSKNVKSSKTDLYKNMIRFSSYYNVVFDKSKDDKNVEINILDIPDEKIAKNFIEKNDTLKFIQEKNSITSYFNKEFKGIGIDNKTKNFLTYLIIVHFYTDIQPILSITRPFNIKYVKKIIEKDDKGVVVEIKKVDSEKNVAIIMHKLNPNVISNSWQCVYAK
tara:strand:+ start:2551 stop:3777 length:1227 start_codon:yes stop_codon:yes gene_type:complete